VLVACNRAETKNFFLSVEIRAIRVISGKGFCLGIEDDDKELSLQPLKKKSTVLISENQCHQRYQRLDFAAS